MSKKTPQIRFKGFTDDWEERKLGDISDKVKEKNKTGEFTETLTNSAEHGIINQRDFFDKDISNAKNLDGYYVVKNNDFVYNPRISNFAPVGPIKRNKLGRTGVMSPLYYVFRAHDIDKDYFEKYFDTVYWHKFMELNGDSGARADRFAIKDSVFAEMPIPYPNIDEQQKIGAFFKQLDDTTALYQRKLDLLKEQKKGFLQKMFPKDGAKVPELRFSGFADDWEERKLGEISKTTIGEFVIKTKQSNESPYPVYNGGRSYTGKYDEYNNDGPKIVISARGANAGFVNYVSGRYWAGNSCYSVSVTKEDEFSIGYLYQFIKYNQVLFTAYQQAANIPSVSKSDVEKFSIKYPTVLEQKKIESFFKQLDNAIALHQRKLDLLKEQKKGFLQKMFVS